MKYRAVKPLYLTESDWALKIEKPKDFSFSPDMVEKQTALSLPENEFFHGLATEGLIVAVHDKSQKARPVRKEVVSNQVEKAVSTKKED